MDQVASGGIYVDSLRIRMKVTIVRVTFSGDVVWKTKQTIRNRNRNLDRLLNEVNQAVSPEATYDQGRESIQ